MTTTAEPTTSEAIGTADDHVCLRDFTVYREASAHTCFESTADLWIRNGNEEWNVDRDPGIVAIWLRNADDHTEVVVDVFGPRRARGARPGDLPPAGRPQPPRSDAGRPGAADDAAHH